MSTARAALGLVAACLCACSGPAYHGGGGWSARVDFERAMQRWDGRWAGAESPCEPGSRLVEAYLCITDGARGEGDDLSRYRPEAEIGFRLICRSDSDDVLTWRTLVLSGGQGCRVAPTDLRLISQLDGASLESLTLLLNRHAMDRERDGENPLGRVLVPSFDAGRVPERYFTELYRSRDIYRGEGRRSVLDVSVIEPGDVIAAGADVRIEIVDVVAGEAGGPLAHVVSRLHAGSQLALFDGSITTAQQQALVRRHCPSSGECPALRAQLLVLTLRCGEQPDPSFLEAVAPEVVVLPGLGVPCDRAEPAAERIRALGARVLVTHGFSCPVTARLAVPDASADRDWGPWELEMDDDVCGQ